MTTDIGRDRRLVRHPAAVGSPDAGRLESRPHVAVVGAGIAGLAAATGLAERGVTVDLVEREPYLGGRVGGWRTRLPDGSPIAMNRGFHAFFRQYYNLRALLRRGDPALDRLRPVDDYPLIDGHGRRDSFRGLPRTPPWNALAFALRSPTFRLRDLAGLDARAAAPLAAVSVPDVYRRLDHMDAETFLERINFPPAARHLAFEVFSRSFFTDPAQLSAAELATMFHIYFLGSSEGLVFDVPDTNFDELWAPVRDHLTARCRGTVRIHTGVAITTVESRGSGRFRLHDTTGAVLEADAVVLATDIAGLQRIVAASPTLGTPAWRAGIERLPLAPPFVVQRLWLDRPVAADRAAFLGTADLDPLDNISVLERYERQAAQWAREHRGSVVELHAYAVSPQTVDDSERSARLRDRMLAQLHAIYPETAAARIVGEEILHRADCPAFAPGEFARRPTIETPDSGLVLAGDGIRVDLPVALMERAATTGWSAANQLLARWELAGHPLCTVPTRGRSALLRRLVVGKRDVAGKRNPAQ